MKKELNPYNIEVGARLKELRSSRKLTQDQLAKAIGITRSCIAHHEIGDVELVLSHLRSYAVFYNVTMDYIAGLELPKAEDISNTNKQFIEDFKASNLDDNETIMLDDYLNFIKSKRGV